VRWPSRNIALNQEKYYWSNLALSCGGIKLNVLLKFHFIANKEQLLDADYVHFDGCCSMGFSIKQLLRSVPSRQQHKHE
jgi:hypothetical protein